MGRRADQGLDGPQVGETLKPFEVGDPLKIEYAGETYDYDEHSLTIQQWIAIEKHLGGPVFTTYARGLLEGSVASYQALAWLLLRGGDLAVPIASMDDFPMLKLAGGYLDALREQITGTTEALDTALAGG